MTEVGIKPVFRESEAPTHTQAHKVIYLSIKVKAARAPTDRGSCTELGSDQGLCLALTEAECRALNAF